MRDPVTDVHPYQMHKRQAYAKVDEPNPIRCRVCLAVKHTGHITKVEVPHMFAYVATCSAFYCRDRAAKGLV